MSLWLCEAPEAGSGFRKKIFLSVRRTFGLMSLGKRCSELGATSAQGTARSRACAHSLEIRERFQYSRLLHPICFMYMQEKRGGLTCSAHLLSRIEHAHAWQSLTPMPSKTRFFSAGHE